MSHKLERNVISLIITAVNRWYRFQLYGSWDNGLKGKQCMGLESTSSKFSTTHPMSMNTLHVYSSPVEGEVV